MDVAAKMQIKPGSSVLVEFVNTPRWVWRYIDKR